jgi:hypothetical protein
MQRTQLPGGSQGSCGPYIHVRAAAVVPSAVILASGLFRASLMVPGDMQPAARRIDQGIGVLRCEDTHQAKGWLLARACC